MWHRRSANSDTARRESQDSCCSTDSESEQPSPFSLKRLLKYRAEGSPRAKYRFGDEIGGGSFGSVRVVADKKTRAMYACKIMRFTRAHKAERDPETGERVAPYREISEEVESMCDVDHPGLLRLHEYFEVGNEVYIILDLMYGHSLGDELNNRGNFSEEDSRSIFRQLLAAVQYMHNHGVVHRDLKNDNIMFAKKDDFSSVTVVDFGFACRTGGKRMSGCLGTPKYVAPEVLRSEGKSKDFTYGKECDVWSLGVVLYILLSGYPPFMSCTTRKSISRTLAGEFDFKDPVWELISDEAKELICRLLTVNPAERITPAEALSHPWLQDV
eukprot:jgi/Tetstr1/422321/TSEL_013164.t1